MSSINDLGHGCLRHAVLRGEHSTFYTRRSQTPNGENIIVSQFSVPVAGSTLVLNGPKVMVGVLFVATRCDVFKVLRAAIVRVAVLVVHLHAIRAWSEKRARHEHVNQAMFDDAVHGEIDTKVPVAVLRGQHASSNATDPSEATDFVDALVLVNRPPFFAH
jgi:hypothetical protein